MHDTDKDKQFEYPTIKDLYPLNKTVDVDKIRETFTNACIDARQRQLYKMEQEFLQNYLMASSLESEKEAYPIYELVSHIRNDVLIDTPTVKDPLKDLIGDVTELAG